MGAETRHGPTDHRLAAKKAILLGPAGTSAQSPSGGNDDDSGALSLSLILSLIVGLL